MLTDESLCHACSINNINSADLQHDGHVSTGKRNLLMEGKNDYVNQGAITF